MPSALATGCLVFQRLPATKGCRTSDRLLLSLVLAGLTALGVGCNEDNKRFVALSNQGIEALDREDYDGAEVIFADAAKLQPEDADVQFYLGTIRLRDGKHKKAAEHFEASLRTDGERPDAHLSLAKCWYEQHQPKEALAALQKLFKIDSGHPQGHLLAARIALAQKDRKAADTALRAAIAGDPGFDPAYQMLARLYTDATAFEAARLVLQEGLKFSPDSFALRESLGLTMLDLGRPDRAKVELESAAALPRARPEVHFNLAAAQLQTGDREQAMLSLKTFLVQAHGLLPDADPLVQQAAQLVIKLKNRPAL